MDAKIIEVDAFRAVGVLNRVDPATCDWMALWTQQFFPRMGELMPLAAKQGAFGLFVGVEGSTEMDFLAAVQSRPGAEPPAGMVAWDVAAGTYATFDCTVSTIAQTWSGAFEDWLPNSAYEHDPSRPCFEYYPPSQPGPNMPVIVHVAVNSA